MRPRTIIAALLTLAFTAVASATPMWTTPGWYQVADTIVGPFVWRGPFESKEACEAVLPANEEDADYSCEWLQERPSWDE